VIAEEARDGPWKRPGLAAALGIVPGLGYLYTGHTQTAIASLIVNGVFVGATWQAFREDQDVLGGFLAVFSLSWYAGNIYGAAHSADRANSHLQQRYWERLRY
jgi:hypothetical protein